MQQQFTASPQGEMNLDELTKSVEQRTENVRRDVLAEKSQEFMMNKAFLPPDFSKV
jgi:hypothetical protein